MEQVASSVLTLIPSTQTFISIFFFSFAAAFFMFSLLLLLLRSRPWCNCEVCSAYLNSTWANEFVNLCDWYTHLLRLSPTGTIHIHVLGNTITSNPDNVEYMLKTNFDNFPKGKTFSSILGDLLGNGIFNVDGDAWRFQRKMASLELGSVSVRTHAFEIVTAEVSQRLLPLLSSISAEAPSAAPIDLQDVFRRFAFDNICKISFGLDPACLDLSLPLSEFAAAFDLASLVSARRAVVASPIVWKVKRMLNLGSEKELRRSIRLVNDLADKFIRERRKLGFASNHDLLSRFMASVDNDKYLRDIVISFLLAGRDTVASGLTAFFLLISQHPHVTAAIREEVDEFIRGDAPPTYEQLRGMHYVHAALFESMRLFPPVQFDSKYCLEDDVLADGTFVSKDTRVTYHPYAMGRMETIWGRDSLDFNPERWLQDGVFAPVNQFKYPVFQGGLRVCLGKEMAIMEMKTVIVTILREFNIEPVGSVGLRPKFAAGLTASLAGGLPVKVSRRR